MIVKKIFIKLIFIILYFTLIMQAQDFTKAGQRCCAVFKSHCQAPEQPLWEMLMPQFQMM